MSSNNGCWLLPTLLINFSIQIPFNKKNHFVSDNTRFIAKSCFFWKCQSFRIARKTLNEWVKSKYTHGSQKFAPNCFLYLIMPNNSSFCPLATIKMCTLSKAPPSQSDHIINTHMKQVKTLDMDLSWDHLNTVYGLKIHIWPQKQQFGCYFSFQEKNWHPPSLPNWN